MSRWTILLVLFLARFTMAFQFQAVAALSPLYQSSYAADLADIGFLIGLYLAPGIIVALPGGTIAARFGEKRIVALAMVMMLLGGFLTVVFPNWEAVVAGRLLSGAGGVVLNIVMTKMLVDWFQGREISTAMAIFVNSWPVGIAVALLVLPLVADAGGLMLARVTVLAVIALGLVLFTAFYSPPEGIETGPVRLRFEHFPVFALFLASLIWALYNTALAMVFSFGPALLSERGWDLTEASSTTSLFMLVLAASIPLGGIMADRTGRRDAVILTSFVGYIVLMPLAPSAPGWSVPALFLVVGLIFGLAAGPIMTLPASVLPPKARTFGMGVFFTIYYCVMMIAPTVAGDMAERQNNVAIAIYLGAGMLAVSIAALWLFRRAATRAATASA